MALDMSKIQVQQEAEAAVALSRLNDANKKKFMEIKLKETELDNQGRIVNIFASEQEIIRRNIEVLIRVFSEVEGKDLDLVREKMLEHVKQLDSFKKE